VASLGAGDLKDLLRHRLDLSGTTPSAPLRRLLVHATASLARVEEVRAHRPGLEAYDQRALMMAACRDLVLVQGTVDTDYVDYLQELGVGPAPSDIIALDRDAGAVGRGEACLPDGGVLARRLPADEPVRIEPFVAGWRELELARRIGERLGREVTLLGDPAVVERVNRKDLQRRWAEELGVPIAEGEVVTLEPAASGHPTSVAPLRAATERRLRQGHAALLRGSEGASGSATRLVAGAADLAAALDWAAGRAETTYLVDRVHDVGVSPNLLLFIPPRADRPVHVVAATDQVLDANLSHTGNSFPSCAALLDEMVAYGELLARRLRDEGYAGWLGCDFCEYRDPVTGARALFFAELNARINGACYPVALAANRRASGQAVAAFVGGLFRTGAGSFAELANQLGPRLLRAGRPAGLVPYNTGCLTYGYCAVVVLDATPEAARQRWGELARELAPGGQEPPARGASPGSRTRVPSMANGCHKR
jgi:hypothetical protein